MNDWWNDPPETPDPPTWVKDVRPPAGFSVQNTLRAEDCDRMTKKELEQFRPKTLRAARDRLLFSWFCDLWRFNEILIPIEAWKWYDEGYRQFYLGEKSNE